MLRVILFRLALIALPFVLWLVWKEISRRRGKPMGSSPWAWLLAAGLALAALSLFAGVLLGGQRDPDAAYKPVITGSNGKVIPGAR